MTRAMIVGAGQVVDAEEHQARGPARCIERRGAGQSEVGDVFGKARTQVRPPEVFFVAAGELEGVEPALGLKNFASAFVNLPADVEGEFGFHLFGRGLFL